MGKAAVNREVTRLEVDSFVECVRAVQLRKTQDAKSLRTYKFDQGTIVKILDTSDPKFLLIRDDTDRRGYLEVEAYADALQGIVFGKGKFLFEKFGASMDPCAAEFVEAVPNMLGETTGTAGLFRDESATNTIESLPKGTPFIVLRRQQMSRLAEVKLLNSAGTVGYVELYKEGITHTEHLNRKNPLLEKDSHPLVSLKVGQILSTNQELNLYLGELPSAVKHTLSVDTAIAIKSLGGKRTLRVEVEVVGEEEKSGWVSCLDKNGNDVIGLEQIDDGTDLWEKLEGPASSDDVNAFANVALNNADHARADGTTILMYASSKGSIKVVEYLLSRGASPNYEDGQGLTALHLASKSLKLELFEALANAGANVNYFDKKETTPLYHLVANNASDPNVVAIVKFLLERRADPNVVDSEGRTALRFAKDADNDELKAVLKNAGGRCAASNAGFDVARVVESKNVSAMVARASGAAKVSRGSAGATTPVTKRKASGSTMRASEARASRKSIQSKMSRGASGTSLSPRKISRKKTGEMIVEEEA